MTRSRILLATLAALAIGAIAWLGLRPEAAGEDDRALLGEARTGGVTVSLPEAARNIRIVEARVPGRPLVLIDPGHGGRDPGATGVGGSREASLTLAMAGELRDLLAERGRVRVGLTREDDRYLDLEQRAAIARSLGTALFVSIHMDSAPNPLARGVTVYSLSDVASSAEAAAMAARENRAFGGGPAKGETSVDALLADLALREQMEDSAAFATRLLRRAAGPVELRPRPHQFANFHVLRTAAVPAVLIEAGYISNVEDEARLTTPEGRRPLVETLARAIEADAALRRAE